MKTSLALETYAHPKRRAIRFNRRAVFLGLGLLVLLGQIGGHAQTVVPDALPYSAGYLLTGDYVVGSVDLDPRTGTTNHLLSGTIPMSGVPANADITAAFLYWEMISPQVAPAVVGGATFRGQPLASTRIKSSAKALTGNQASCFASGTGLTLTMFRADVLQLLPPQRDPSGVPTGKLLVNDTDLRAFGLPLHTVGLPGTQGNATPQSAGATLFVVYRDPTKPLKKIVVYDGVSVQTPGAPTSQMIRGFYRSAGSTAGSAKLTEIVGSGAPNKTDREWFSNLRTPSTLLATNGLSSTNSPGSDRAWSTVTYDVSALMPGKDFGDGYGETVQAFVDHGNTSPNDCFAFTAILFSTNVPDVDHDGIPDAVEDALSPLKDPPTPQNPNGVTLPNLHAMGASSGHKDLFIEVNAMTARPGTTYGSAASPYGWTWNGQQPVVTEAQRTDPVGHNHMPMPDVLQQIGDAYKAAPLFKADGITPDFNTDGSPGISVHFDVGNLDAYHQLAGGGPAANVADEYLVKSDNARGGEQITETACQVDPNPSKNTCTFPAWPGTVGWGFSLERYLLGLDLDATGNSPRLDANRTEFFHYLMYAHTRGTRKSTFPCLDAAGKPIGASGAGACTVAVNPDYFVPSSSSGVSDLPGNRAIVSLGRWENFVGTSFIQASTTFHELGHNLGLWHGGAPPTYVKSGAAVVKTVEPNCKPNYLSSMSYLFQLSGMLDDLGHLNLNYSDQQQADLNKSSFVDGAFLPSPAYRAGYQTAWYAPLVPGSLGVTLGISPAKKSCNGLAFAAGYPPIPMGRIPGPNSADSIDWDGLGLGTSGPQDVNLDGSTSGTLRGFNDWSHIRLDQIGGGHIMGDVSNGGQDFGGQDFGGQDFGGQDFGGQDFGGQDFGGQDFGGQDFGGVDMDGQDFGGQDFGGQDFGGSGELTHEDAVLLGNSSPTNFTACVIDNVSCVGQPSQFHRVKLAWTIPHVGTAILYHLFRADTTTTNGVITSATPPVEVGTTSLLTFVDTEELPNGRTFTYYAKADFDDGNKSGPSNFAKITAINDPPVVLAEAFNTNEDTSLTTGNVLANDTDVDSNHAGLRAVLVSGPSHANSFTLNPDGSFSYAPNDDFETSPTDSFTYKANDGTWSRDANVVMSGYSNTATVTITVVARHTITTVQSSSNPSVYGDAVTFTATVAPVSPQLGTPIGSVTFKDGTTTLGVGALVGGQATFNTSSLATLPSAGAHSITAVYCGPTNTVCPPDTVFYGSTSSTLVQTILKKHLTVTADVKSKTYDGAVYSPFTATLSGFVPGQTDGGLRGSGDLSGYAAFSGAATITAVNAGSYPISPTGGTLTATNYDFTVFIDGTLTIIKATSTTIVMCPAAVTFSGLAQAPCTASVTGAGGLNQPLVVSYTNNTNAGTAAAGASYGGDVNHYGSNGAQIFTIARANPSCIVTGYNVAFDNNPHTASGSCVFGEGNVLAGLDLSGTTQTAVGDYPADPWSFTDGTGNYNNASGTVHDHIAGVSIIAPPPSVQVDMLTSSTLMFEFVEQTNFTLTSGVQVDISAPGTVVSAAQLTPLTIAAGTVVNSTYLHHDQPGSVQNTQNVSITFPTDVLGIIAVDASLVASNTQLGAPGTAYHTTSAGQGYELTTNGCSTGSGVQDQVTLSADRRTVSVCTNVYGAPDDIRILTKVP